MSLKFNLQFFGGQASVLQIPKRTSSNNMSYSTQNLEKVAPSWNNGQVSKNNTVVKELADIAKTGTLPKRREQMRVAI